MQSTRSTQKGKPFAASVRIVGSAVAAACALVALPAAALQTYSITAIAGGNCAPVSISDRGDVAGECDNTAVVWHNGATSVLGRLAGGTFSIATATNAFGLAVGDGDTGNGRPQSWVSTPTGLLNFFPNNGGNTHALFIGDNGYIGGFYTKSLSGNVSSWRGAVWTPDPKSPGKYREVDLPILPGGTNTKLSASIPQAFNQLGQAAGYAQTDAIGEHAVFWNNDAAHSIVDLGTLPGDWSSLGWGMNDLGQVVGESHPPSGSIPVLWGNDAAHTATALPLLPGDNYGTAHSINGLGQVLGWSAYAEPGTWNVGPSRQVIWRDGAVFEVQALLDPVAGAGWTVSQAIAINNLGQIVGMGTFNGQAATFVMTPMAQ